MKAKHDKGFSLVEVMVALAVVAIVSTSLFQMFVTTSYVNRDAQVMDLANIIAVGQAESFKADPENYDSTTKYYNSDGTIDIPAKAVIQVDSTVTPTDLEVNDTGYFPSFVGTIDLSPFININKDPVTGIETDEGCDVQITASNEINIGFHGKVLTPLPVQDSSLIKNNILPIKVSFVSGTQTSRTINLINNSTVEVDVYFFTPVINSSDPAEQSVTFNPVAGYSSLTNVKQTTSENTKYHLELTVSKLIGAVSQFMFTYATDKYIYH